MYKIGSGEVNTLLASNKTSKTYNEFIKKFFGITDLTYNAYHSPIDHLRIGQITEDNYAKIIGDEWFSQVKVPCKDIDVLEATLDFAQIDGEKVIAFREVKSINFNDFIEMDEDFDIQKKKRTVYNQVQHQLLCTELDKTEVVFICVYDYEDEENINRVITDDEIKIYTVTRDEKVIENIRNSAEPFQIWKDMALN